MSRVPVIPLYLKREIALVLNQPHRRLGHRIAQAFGMSRGMVSHIKTGARGILPVPAGEKWWLGPAGHPENALPHQEAA